MIEEHPLHSITAFLGCNKADMFDGCMVSQGTLHTGYCSSVFRLDECFILICTNGEMIVELDGHRQMLLSHSLMVCQTNKVLQMICNSHCSFICVIPSADYLSRQYNYWKQILPLILEVKEKNIIPLNQTETERYEHMAECVTECMHSQSLPGWTHESIAFGIKMLLYAIFAKLKDITDYEDKDEERASISRNDEYFSQFMHLLSLHYRQERKVDYYASQLCITSKYLSSIIKKVSGKTPSQWIDDMVMEEIHYLLKNSGMSIKEIAYRMNFTNASFFGKYVKRYLGMSPHHYRMTKDMETVQMYPEAL